MKSEYVFKGAVQIFELILSVHITPGGCVGFIVDATIRKISKVAVMHFVLLLNFM